MTRIHQRHATTVLGLALILIGFAALVFEWSPQEASFQPLPESILASTTGTSPSWHNDRNVNCHLLNVERENGADPPPDPPFVSYLDCEGAPDDSPCIKCTVVSTIQPANPDPIYQTDDPGGLVGPNDSVDCGSGESSYQFGTIGHCEDGVCVDRTEDYACTTALDIYQEQSGNPAG